MDKINVTAVTIGDIIQLDENIPAMVAPDRCTDRPIISLKSNQRYYSVQSINPGYTAEALKYRLLTLTLLPIEFNSGNGVNAVNISFNIYDNFYGRILMGEEKEIQLKKMKEVQFKNLPITLSGKKYTLGVSASFFAENSTTHRKFPAWLLPTIEDIKYNEYHSHAGCMLEIDTSQNALSMQLSTSRKGFVGLRYCIEEVHGKLYTGFLSFEKTIRKFNEAGVISLKTVMDMPKVAPAQYVKPVAECKNVYGFSRKSKPFVGGECNLLFGNVCENKCIDFVKALDAIIGVACVALLANFDSKRRRTTIGHAGDWDFHPSSAGGYATLEYKVLSNAVLMHPFISNLVLGIARRVVLLADIGFRDQWKASEEEVTKAINNCDAELAKQILLRNESLFKMLIEAEYPWIRDRSLAFKRTPDVLFNVFMNGAESVIEEPTNFKKNWILADQKAWDYYGKKQNVSYNIEKVMKGNKI